MSERYPGGIISQTAPVPSGSYATSTASGVWTMEQAAYWQQQGNWPTAGNTDPSAFIENLFQTWLYTGTGASQTITNGIDLAGKGGMVWIKARTQPSFACDNVIFDTTRGTGRYVRTNLSNAEVLNQPTTLTAFNANGFSLGTDSTGQVNWSGNTYASWTFREQPKFFDIVTYTGNGTARTIAHNLGSTPGMIIVKRTDTTANWRVYHRSTGKQSSLFLNLTNAASTGDTDIWNDTDPTSTVFSVGTNAGVNASGGTYVAYLFAHDAGGFGLTGTDNVISCGSFTTDGSARATVTLGWEPQFVLVKRTNSATAGDWFLMDTMRGYSLTGNNMLSANTSAAENVSGGYGNPTATGFFAQFEASSPYIYMAIRRGPMKTPTSGTQVFSPFARAGTGSAVTVSGAGFAPDLFLSKTRNTTIQTVAIDRLRGGSAWLGTASTSAESPDPEIDFGATMNGLGITTGDGIVNSSSFTYIQYMLKRFPGFMDVVCYTGQNITNQRVSHNLGVVPELIILKSRSTAALWYVYASPVTSQFQYLQISGANAVATNGAQLWGTSGPTTTDFGINNTATGTGLTTATFVSYLFATVAGVSKVGSYTGTGTTQIVNCGFTTGARFVLIKRTDSTGDWYVWDSARGIVAGNDPYLLLNSTAAEITNTDYVDTASSGFEISSTAPAAINANGGTFIFLAIA